MITKTTDDILDSLRQHGINQPEMLLECISGLSEQKKQAVMNTLMPDISASLSQLHQNLFELHRPFEILLNGTYAELAQFPSAGIPAQSKAISQQVIKGCNAGIGIAHDPDGEILAAPFVNRFLELLKPETCNQAIWNSVRNELLKYTSSLGAAWYRKIARLRYLRDGSPNETLKSLMHKSMVSDPIPCNGGTSALSLIFWLYGGAGCPVVFPRTYWGNMNLKCRLHGMQVEVCDYMDNDGVIIPQNLRDILNKIRDRGFSKAIVYFNFPHNPTGVMPTESEAEALGNICREAAANDFSVVAVSDEPYFPFLRGSKSIRVPFSYYLQPLNCQNMITAVSINGTKRDGIYGFRHSDLIFQYPLETSTKAVKILEDDILQGLLRGLFSFSNVLNQYIVGRGLTQNPLIPLMNSADIELSEEAFHEEQQMVDQMASEVLKTASMLSVKDFEGFNRIGSEDAAGGFFVSHVADGISSNEVHRTGLQNQCGIISAGDYVRINALLPSNYRSQFIQNLKRTLDICKKSGEESKED